MTMQEIRNKVTQREIETRFVAVDVDGIGQGLRLIRLWASVVTILRNNGETERVPAELITAICM